MKKASELAIEYWNKPPMDRMHTTLQDYVYDYMSSQNERLHTQAIADAAEISRLQSGFDELKEWCNDQRRTASNCDGFDDWNIGREVAFNDVVDEINRITGGDK